MKSLWFIVLLTLFQISPGLSLNIMLLGERINTHLFAASILGIRDNLNVTPTFVQLYNDDANILDNICQLNSSTIDGIVDLSQTNVGSNDIARQFDSFLISIKDWYPNLPLEMYSVPTVRPTSNQYIESVVAFMNSLNAPIDSVLILFSVDFDSSLLFPSQDTNGFPSIYMKQVNSSTILDAISFINQLRVSEIILASDLNLVTMIIKQAVDAGILNGVYHWYVITKDLQTFVCPLCSNGMFLLFQKKIINQALFARIMTVNSSLINTNQAVEMIYAYQAGQVLGKIIMQSQSAGTWNGSSSSFSCWTPKPNITLPYRYNLGLSLIKNVALPNVLGDILFNQTNRNQFAQVLLSEITVGAKPSIKSNVMWTRNIGLAVNNISSDIIIRRNLKVLVIQEPPFVIKTSNNSFVGYSIDILANLAKIMNFNYQIYEQVDSKYGVVTNNGSFSGLIGAIASNKYDMAVGAITITSDRQQVVDFSIPYYDYSAIQILMKVVTVSTQGDQLFFLKAFTWDVWVTVIATIIGTGFLITFVDRVSPFSFQNRLKNDELRDGEADGKIFTIKESMWFVLGAYTQAGESFDPRSISCRVIVVGLWLFAYLMMAMYTANLSAQLTVAQLASRPGSLTELAAQQTMTYTTQANTSIYDYFYRMKQAETDIFNYWTDKGIKNLNNPAQTELMSTWQYPVTEMYTNMFNKMAAWGFTANISDSINNIVNKDWAIFLETPIIKYYTNRDCRIIAKGDPFSQRPYGIVLQKNSPLLNNMNFQILTMQSNRILEELKVHWWNNDSVSCNTADSTTGLGLDTLGGAFIFLLVGILIAFIIFVFEKIVAKIWGTEWAKHGAIDATVIRPMGMMSTINVNYGSHVDIHRHSQGSMRRPSHIHHIHRQAKHSIPNSEDHEHNVTEEVHPPSTLGQINEAFDKDNLETVKTAF